MPELPDVEGFRRVLAKHAVGAPIRRVLVRDAGVLRGTTARRLADVLRGRLFRKPSRHGKWLIAPTDRSAVLLFHFGMTGSLEWERHGAPQRHDRVIFAFDRGELRYRDLRKLQGLRLARDDAEVGAILRALGPDALDVSPRTFDERIAGRARLKAILMDQSVIAGLGNLLVDEILWRARINPARPANRLSGPERAAVFREMRRVLRDSIRVGRVPPRGVWLTGRRDDASAKCPRCATRLRRGTIAGRTTVWCPRCQPTRRGRSA
jgi:formamidopyrimidine-DNA glycosylase